MRIPHFNDTGMAIRFCDYYRGVASGAERISQVFADMEKYLADDRWDSRIPAFGPDGGSPVRVPVAGSHEIDKTSVRELRKAIYAAIPAGFEKSLSEVLSGEQPIRNPNKAPLDSWLGKELESHLSDNSERDKSSPAFWRTIAILVLPELVFWRFGGTDYFSGDKHQRIYPRQAYAQWVMIGEATVTTSAVQAIVERPGVFVDPVVSRKFARYLMDQRIGDSDAKKIGKAYSAEALLCCLERLDDPELQAKFEAMRVGMGIFQEDEDAADDQD